MNVAFIKIETLIGSYIQVRKELATHFGNSAVLKAILTPEGDSYFMLILPFEELRKLGDIIFKQIHKIHGVNDSVTLLGSSNSKEFKQLQKSEYVAFLLYDFIENASVTSIKDIQRTFAKERIDYLMISIVGINQLYVIISIDKSDIGSMQIKSAQINRTLKSKGIVFRVLHGCP